MLFLHEKTSRKLKLPVPELSQWQSAVSLMSVWRDGHAALSAVAAELQSVVKEHINITQRGSTSWFQILFGKGAI